MQVVKRSHEQHHGWNCPYQLTKLPRQLSRFLLREDHCTDCDTYAVEVQEGDLVLVFSDGVRDNLHDPEVLRIVDRAVSPALAELAGLPEHPTPPEKVAAAIALAAKVRSMDTTARVPFNVYSRRHGFDRAGGKEDDITVVAAWVVPECGSTVASFSSEAPLAPLDEMSVVGAGRC
jgi:protein phosphatase PTC7